MNYFKLLTLSIFYLVTACSTEAQDDLLEAKVVSEGNYESNFGIYESYSFEELKDSLMKLPGLSEKTNYLREKEFHVFEGKLKLSEYATIGLVDAANRHFVDSMLQLESIKNLFPANLKFMWGQEEIAGTYGLYAIKILNDEESISSKHLQLVREEFMSEYGDWIIQLTFNEQGAELIKNLTKNNLKNYLYIIVNERIISTPLVQGEISDGKVQISGSFTEESAKDLAAIIRGKN